VRVDLEVQVAAGGVAQRADLAELLPDLDVLAVGDGEGLHVGVPGGQPAGPGADVDEPAAGPGLVCSDDDAAGGGRADRCAAGGG
jgi:hypothetical protein